MTEKEGLIKDFKEDVFNKFIYRGRWFKRKRCNLVIMFRTNKGEMEGYMQEIGRKKGETYKEAIGRSIEDMWAGMKLMLIGGKKDELGWCKGGEIKFRSFKTAKGEVIGSKRYRISK